MNSAPRFGSVSVSPVTGIELVTVFDFEASDWYDAETPLSYQFEFVSYSLLSMTLMARAEKTYAEGVLPAGNPEDGSNVTCVVRVFDSLDAFAVTSTKVVVTPAIGDSVGLLTESITSSSALSDVDTLKQLISVGTTVINHINASEAVAINCVSLNRVTSISLGNSCGSCKTGFVGESAPSLSACVSSVLNAAEEKSCSNTC